MILVRRGNREETFRLSPQGQGEYILTTEIEFSVILWARINAPGYESFRTDQWPESHALAVELTPLEALRVVVTDESGVRIDRIPVQLAVPSWSYGRIVWPRESEAPRQVPRVSEEITDRQGEALFHGLLPGRGYEITAMGKDLLAPASVSGVEVSAGGSSETRIVVRRGAKILGTVVDSYGRLGAGCRISLKKEVRDGGGFVPEQSTVIGDNGFFEFEGLSAGRKLLRFSRTLQEESAHEFFTLRMSLDAGEVHDCGVVGPEPISDGGVQVVGQVVYPDGTPARGCKLRARVGPRGATKDMKLDFSPDEQGMFGLLGIPPQELFLSASARTTDGRDYFVSERWALKPGETKSITLILEERKQRQSPGGDILIELVTAEEEPIDLSEQSDLTPYVIDPRGAALLVATGAPRNTSGDLSNLLLVGRPPPGRYRLLVAGEGLASSVHHCTVHDKEVTVVEVGLQPAAEITGRVLNEDGDPISAVVGRTFEETVPARAMDLVQPIRADGSGRFTLSCFVEGAAGNLAIISRDHGARLVPCIAPANFGDILLSAK